MEVKRWKDIFAPEFLINNETLFAFFQLYLCYIENFPLINRLWVFRKKAIKLMQNNVKNVDEAVTSIQCY